MPIPPAPSPAPPAPPAPATGATAALTSPPATSRYIPALMALIILFTGAAYFPALSAGLVDLDDYALLVSNTRYQELSGESLRWMFTTTYMGHYMPLTWLSYWLDYTIAGDDPFLFHLTNIVIHAVNAGLFFLILIRLLNFWLAPPPTTPTGPTPLQLCLIPIAAAIGASVWAVHPLRVESVAWVTERRDVLSVLFLLMTLLAWFRALSPPIRATSRATANTYAPWRSPWYFAALALLLLSLLSKSWGMSFFVILLILDVFPLRRLRLTPLNLSTWRGHLPILLEKAPFAALGLLFVVIAGGAQRSAGAVHTVAEWGIAERAAQAAYGLVFYTQKTLWPTNLAVLYEIPRDLNPFAPFYLLCYALVIAAGVLLVRALRTAPGAAAAGAIYLITLAPVLGILQSGDQFVADRYSYIAVMAWSALLAAGLILAIPRIAAQSPEQTRRIWLICSISAAAIAGTLFVGTWRQTTVWHNSERLWHHAIEAGAGTSGVHTAYALAVARDAMERGEDRWEEATQHLLIAIEVDPGNGRAWFILGNTLREQGLIGEAGLAFSEAARKLPQAYMAYANLGGVLMELGHTKEAIQAFRDAVADIERPRSPREGRASPLPYLSLGAALADTGDIEGAREVLLKARDFPEVREEAEAILRSLPPSPDR